VSDGYKPSARCATCGDQSCCSAAPGIYYPEDFDYPEEEVRIGLRTGKVSIDYWEDDPPIYYARPRIVGAGMVDPSWGGKCSHLTATGCSLDWKKRPRGCRMLEPSDKGECDEHGHTKKHGADSWAGHQDWLEDIAEGREQP